LMMGLRPAKRNGAEELAAAELCCVALRGFPQSILPNPFVQEMCALLPTVPLTKEVAADIFEHGFGKAFENAAKRAWPAIENTCYARFYNLTKCDYADVPLYKRCADRAQAQACGRSVAANGKIIEWQQIITTHNLAVLFSELSLDQSLQPHLAGMALRCWRFICVSLRRLPPKESGAWRRRLQSAKDMAYALRQMLFFLSRLPGQASIDDFLVQAEAAAAKEPNPNVRHKLQGEVLPQVRQCLPEPQQAGGPILGWSSNQEHPLLKGL